MNEGDPERDRLAYVVIGPHRSGTSAMARILSLAGARLPRDLVAAHARDNPTGYWEARSVIRLNDAILEAWGGSWKAPPPSAAAVSPDHLRQAQWILRRMFPRDGPIVLKDPRISLTGGFWAQVLAREGLRPFFIVVHREPAEVAASSCESYDLQSDEARELWRVYAERALAVALSHPHAVVAHPQILGNPRGVLERIGVHEPAGDWAEFEEAASAFLTPSLHRHRSADAASNHDDDLRRRLDELAEAEPVMPAVGQAVERRNDDASPLTWLLISGAPRSGTSLLRALVDDHPDAVILQEQGLTRFVRSLAALVGRPSGLKPSWTPFAGPQTPLERAASFYEARKAAGGAGSRGDLGAVSFDALAQALMTPLTAGRPQVIGDKMPMRGDWEDVDYLLQRLPELRLLVVLRNPRAVINSSMIRRARREMGGDLWPIGSVQEAAEEWWLAWRRTAELAERFGPAIRFVKYESLCEDVDGAMQGIWDWLGLRAHAPATHVERLPASIDALSAEEAGVVSSLLGEIDLAWDDEPDPRRLLARFADIPRPYVPGRRLQAASEDADAVLGEGFSWREAWGRWTDGERAVVRLRHGLTGGFGLLELQIARAFVPDGGSCNVVIQTEGAEPRLFSLGAGAGRIALLCPLASHRAPGVLEVEMRVLDPKTDLDPPADERRLGVGLDWISLRVIP